VLYGYRRRRYLRAPGNSWLTFLHATFIRRHLPLLSCSFLSVDTGSHDVSTREFRFSHLSRHRCWKGLGCDAFARIHGITLANIEDIRPTALAFCCCSKHFRFIDPGQRDYTAGRYGYPYGRRIAHVCTVYFFECKLSCGAGRAYVVNAAFVPLTTGPLRWKSGRVSRSCAGTVLLCKLKASCSYSVHASNLRVFAFAFFNWHCRTGRATRLAIARGGVAGSWSPPATVSYT
jgi:hypothetical protein